MGADLESSIADVTVPLVTDESFTAALDAPLAKAKDVYRLFAIIDLFFVLANFRLMQADAISLALWYLLNVDTILALCLYVALRCSSPSSIQRDAWNCIFCPNLNCALAAGNFALNSMTTVCWIVVRLSAITGTSASGGAICFFLFAAIARICKLRPMWELYSALCDCAVGSPERLVVWSCGKVDEMAARVLGRCFKMLSLMIVVFMLLMTTFLWSHQSSWSQLIDVMSGSRPAFPPGLVEPDHASLQRNLSSITTPIMLGDSACFTHTFSGATDACTGTFQFCCDPRCDSLLKVSSGPACQAARAILLGSSAKGALSGVAAGAAAAAGGAAAGAEAGAVAGIGGVGGLVGLVGGLVAGHLENHAEASCAKVSALTQLGVSVPSTCSWT